MLKGWNDRAEISDYLFRHHPDIAVKPRQVSYDMKACWNDLLVHETQDREEMRKVHLERLETVYHETWSAYELTIGEWKDGKRLAREVVTTTTEGKRGKNQKGVSRIMPTKLSKKTEYRSGDPALLRTLIEVERQICVLMGLNAPEKMEVTQKDVQNMPDSELERAIGNMATLLKTGIMPVKQDADDIAH